MFKCILIEAGHGKSAIGTKDPGAVKRFVGVTYAERDMVKELSRRVLAILQTKTELGNALIQGVGVETDANLWAKTRYINTVLAENHFTPSKCLRVAIHMNSSGSQTPTGFECWYQRNGKGKELGEALVRSWGKYKITPLRKYALQSTAAHQYKKLYIDDTICPSVLIETSFISNYTDVMAITKDYNRAAEAIAHGIMEYIRGNR